MKVIHLLIFVLLYELNNASDMEYESQLLDLSCRGQKDNAVLGNKFDCSEYLTCHSEQLQRHRCPSGQLFDARTMACQPGDHVDCDGRSLFEGFDHTMAPIGMSTHLPNSQLPSRPIMPTRPAPNNNICLGVENGVRIANPVYCDSYIECQFHFGTERICPTGMNFDELRNTCMDAFIVNCGNRRTRPAPPNQVPGSLCQQWNSGVQLLPHPSNCQQYVICVSGTEIIHTCGNFTHFNPVSLVCDLPELAGCDVSSNMPSAPLPQFPPTPQCRGDYLFFPSLTDCGRYWMCIGTVPVLMSCPRDFYWNDRISKCDLPTRVVCTIES